MFFILDYFYNKGLFLTRFYISLVGWLWLCDTLGHELLQQRLSRTFLVGRAGGKEEYAK